MNVSDIVLSGLIFFVGIYLIYQLVKSYNTISIKSVKLAYKTNDLLEAEAKKIKRRNSTAKNLALLRKYAQAIPWFRVSDKKMENLNYYAKRLNLVIDDNTLTGLDILGIQAAIQTVYIFIVCLLSVFVSLWFLSFILLYKFPAVIFSLVFEGIISDQNELLLKDFRDFYAEFFYNYRHKANRSVRITEVAMRFYNRANSETKILIDNLRADSVQSEEYALDQMKDLFRVVKVHRLADQIKMIITGKTLNTDAMEGFKQEIEAEFRAERKKELELKKFKATLVQGIAWFILTELVMAFSLSAMFVV